MFCGECGHKLDDESQAPPGAAAALGPDSGQCIDGLVVGKDGSIEYGENPVWVVPFFYLFFSPSPLFLLSNAQFTTATYP